MDPNKMTQEDIDNLMMEEFGDRAIYDDEFRKKFANNPYINGMQLNIPDEYAQDYTNEYERLSQPDNYDPLLMYILQKNAQNGFKNGPIGSDSYYEAFDPEYNEDLYPDFTQFMDTYYPDFDEHVNNLLDEGVSELYDLGPGDIYDPSKFDPEMWDLDEDMKRSEKLRKFDKLNNLNYYRLNKDPQEFEVRDYNG